MARVKGAWIKEKEEEEEGALALRIERNARVEIVPHLRRTRRHQCRCHLARLAA